MPQLVAVTQIPKTCAAPHCSKRPRVVVVMSSDEPDKFNLAVLCHYHAKGLQCELVETEAEEEGQQS